MRLYRIIISTMAACSPLGQVTVNTEVAVLSANAFLLIMVVDCVAAPGVVVVPDTSEATAISIAIARSLI